MARIPKYRKHSNRDYAFVEYQGKRIRFPGRHNSAESRSAYASFLRQISVESPEPFKRPASMTKVGELVLAFLPWAETYYKSSTEYEHLQDCCKILTVKAASTFTQDFRGVALKAIRDSMISGDWIVPPRPWSRTHINHQISRVRRIFKWGVEHDMVPPDVLTVLQTVQPLRAGRTAAKESRPVMPVDQSAVAAVLPYLGTVVGAMVRLHHTTGMRSENVCSIRPCDIDRSGPVWIYRPTRHKTLWIGCELLIYLGPKCQEILLPWLDRDPETYCFSPIEAQIFRFEERRANRKTPVQPSQICRKLKNPKRPYGACYKPRSYRRAIWYAFEKADAIMAKEAKKKGTVFTPIVRWHPHQLRHTAGTLVRKRYGLEGAQVYLGHISANVTQLYAERDQDLARRIAEEIG